MPEEDTILEGHKYPFNACELLTSENNFIADKLADVIRLDGDDSSGSDSAVSLSRSISLEQAEPDSVQEENKDGELVLTIDDKDIGDEIRIKEEEYSNTLNRANDNNKEVCTKI
jgi:hypothetical protein